VAYRFPGRARRRLSSRRLPGELTGHGVRQGPDADPCGIELGDSRLRRANEERLAATRMIASGDEPMPTGMTVVRSSPSRGPPIRRSALSSRAWGTCSPSGCRRSAANPTSFGSEFLVRDGASSQHMSRDEIREFFFAEGAIRFDESPCRRFSLDRDLDDETWAAFRRRAKIAGHMDPRTALRNLELLAADGRMTNAGAWLLAKRIRRFHSSAHLSCTLFEGTTKREILDRRDFESDVYSMVDDAMIWVRSKINVRYIITGSVNREERPELPLDAIREAVVNAVAHRDYREGNGPMSSEAPGSIRSGDKEARLRFAIVIEKAEETTRPTCRTCPGAWRPGTRWRARRTGFGKRSHSIWRACVETDFRFLKHGLRSRGLRWMAFDSEAESIE